jgi:Family of unknown function (DUF6101)
MSLLSTVSHSFAASAADPRADGGFRSIHLTSRVVRIDREMSGIKMRLAVPVGAYAGVAFSRDMQNGKSICKVTLEHADEELDVLLDEAPDGPEIRALWRDWADFFSVPALGEGDEAQSQFSASHGFSMAQPRRRGSQIATRRPRFLKRRRCGEPLRTSTSRSTSRRDGKTAE